MRGTRCVQLRPCRQPGIIPAYAGNTTDIGSPKSICRGSSPRMRGTRVRSRDPRRMTGIIPAYAGNTTNYGGCRNRSRDHPRVCGEHYVDHSNHLRPTGSSPRMRGTHVAAFGATCMAGIIPAYAGNTHTGRTATWPEWDHPRVCGEHALYVVGTVESSGSSPRMRGTLVLHHHGKPDSGIIPAYAGNTS